jgi:7-carboxy-7-deazaguanine synthase
MEAVNEEEKGNVKEIFYSIQGEGLWVGRMQHFIRLRGCDVGCSFCDTPECRAGVMVNDFPFENSHFKNPVPVGEVFRILDQQIHQRPGAHSIAITGGEPLVQSSFLKVLIEKIKEVYPHTPILLETAGLHWEEMESVADGIDLVSMDYKLPSTSGLHGTRERHERFLSSLEGHPFYVKAIVDPRTPHREVVDAARAVAAADRSVPFFLQPVTREGQIWGGAYLLGLWSAIREFLQDVRVLPQVHKFLNLS